MQEIICGIYKIENKINKHIYIGQSINILKRWTEHTKDSKKYPNLTLYKAFNKYGIKNFLFSIIEECPKEKLDEREIYWIKYYDSYKNGYNMTPGGKYSSETQRIIKDEEIINIRTRQLNFETFSEVYKDYSYLSEGTFKKIWNGSYYNDVQVEGFTSENREYAKMVAKRKESATRKGSQMTNELVLQIRTDKQQGIKRAVAYEKYEQYFNSISGFDGIWYNKRWKEIQPN